MRKREKTFSILAILSSIVAGCGLILLSIFDTKRHTTLHRLFLLIFMVGVWLTAIFSVVEVRHQPSVGFSHADLAPPQYRWLSKSYADAGRLRLAYRIKGTIALILILLSIAFGVAMYKVEDLGGQFFLL